MCIKRELLWGAIFYQIPSIYEIHGLHKRGKPSSHQSCDLQNLAKIGRSRKSPRPEMLLRLVTAPNWPRFHSRTSAGSIVLLHVQVISHTLPNGRASAHGQVPVPHQCHLILYSIPPSCHTHQSLPPPPLAAMTSYQYRSQQFDDGCAR